MLLKSIFVVHHVSKWVLLLSLVVLALLTLGGRVLLNNIHHFKTEIEQELAEYGITGVSLDKLKGRWEGFRPVLKIQGASLSIPGRSQALSINQLEVSVNLISSLISGDLKLQSLHSTIRKLILVRDKKGYWWLNDIPLNAPSGDADSKLDIHGFFQRLPDYVKMDFDIVQIRDLLFDIDYLIQKGALQSRRENQHLSIKFEALLPEILGREIQLLLKGDALDQRLYIEADNLQIARLLQLASVENTALTEAQLSIKSWIDLERFNIRQIVNKARLTQVLFKSTSAEQQALSFSVQQKIRNESDNWRVDTVIDQIRKGANYLPPLTSQLLVSQRIVGQQKAKPRLWIERMDVSAIKTIVTDGLVNKELARLINGIQPQASVENLMLELDMDDPLQSLLAFDFTQLKSQAYQSIPGVNALAGSLRASQGKAHLDIQSSQLSLDFGDLFRSPIEFESIAANMLVDFNGPDVLVDGKSFSASNRDLELEGRFWLNAPANAKPFLSLRADIGNGRVASTSRYLPAKIMPKEVVQWADTSIKAGKIMRGDMLFHGRLESFEVFNQKSNGIFHALLDVTDPEIIFLPDWPSVHHGTGVVGFYNNEINIHFRGARFATAETDQVTIKIPNMFRARLLVKAQTQTDAETLLETLSQMPVINQIDEIKKKTESISGQIKTVIDLNIPLVKAIKEKIKIKAKADFKNLAISIPDWVVEIEGADGRLDLEDFSISATDIPARYYGDAVLVTVNTKNQGERTIFNMNGNLQASNILRILPDFLSQPVSGVSPWNVTVSVANNPDVPEPLISVKARSHLQGSEVSFPQPLYKAAMDKQLWDFSANLSRNNDLDFKLAIEKILSSEGRLQLDDKTENQIRLLNVNFDSDQKFKKIQSKYTTGVNLSGHIDSLDFNGWNDYLNKISEDSTDNNQYLKIYNSADLEIDVLHWTNQQANNAKLTMSNNGDLLTGTIDSSSARGAFKLPYKMGTEQPLVADLDYIRLQTSDSKKKIKPEIDEMPNLHINSKVISYEDKAFTDFSLITRSEKSKFYIDKLDFSHDKVHLISSGNWHFDIATKEHVSVFNIAVSGSEFGQTLSKLGLGETIKDGTIDFNGQIGWGKELFNLNWPTLIGEVNLNLQDGYLKNVEPGAGRFIGLLSLNALPKRLFLDFGDVLKDGMQFDEIKGQFSIAGEILHTDNASMDSTSAKINLKGTTNLHNKTYNQSMFIIPKVSDALPIIGGLVAGSTVGWGLLLLHQILKKPIGKSVEIEYKVSGSWEEPVIERASKPKPKQDVYDQDESK